MYLIKKQVEDMICYYAYWDNLIKEPIFTRDEKYAKQYKYNGTASNIKKKIDEHYKKYPSKLAKWKENDCVIIKI